MKLATTCEALAVGFLSLTYCLLLHLNTAHANMATLPASHISMMCRIMLASRSFRSNYQRTVICAGNRAPDMSIQIQEDKCNHAVVLAEVCPCHSGA